MAESKIEKINQSIKSLILSEEEIVYLKDLTQNNLSGLPEPDSISSMRSSIWHALDELENSNETI